jgi:hypothetical protein
LLLVLVAVSALAFGAISTARGDLEWQEQIVSGPSPRAEYGFAFDSDRNVSTLFGGSADLSFTAVNRETWEWNGTAWSLVNMAGPVQRCDHAQAYDSIRNLTVIFGGYNGSYFNDTWEWDGASWSNVVGVGPDRRADSFMAFDSIRGFMVLFGGLASTGVIRGDTWEYNGTWVQRASSGPPARWIQRMAYDSDRGVTVMFGGARPGGLLNDTWEWDGTAWTQINIPGPQARYGHAMAYDSERHVTVLFGGQFGFNFGEGVLGDTWEYDGTSWTPVPIAGPSARTFVKMVYDSDRRRMVLFGGYDGTQMVDDTWELVSQQTGGIRWTAPETERLALAQNAPNPFNPHTQISYQLTTDGPARLRILDVSGAHVRTLVDRIQAAGMHAASWDGRDDRGAEVASGIYYYRLDASGSRETRRMALVR